MYSALMVLENGIWSECINFGNCTRLGVWGVAQDQFSSCDSLRLSQAVELSMNIIFITTILIIHIASYIVSYINYKVFVL